MDQQFDDLEPPKPYASLKEIEELLPKLFPPVVNYMSWISGRRSMRLSKKDKLRLGRQLHDFLVVARPYLLGLGTLRGQLDPAQSTYALLEGLLREQYRVGGRRFRTIKMLLHITSMLLRALRFRTPTSPTVAHMAQFAKH